MDEEEPAVLASVPVLSELPWTLCKSECWERLVAPYLAASIEVVILTLLSAQTDSVRAVCQGKLSALRQMQDAPAVFDYVRARSAALKEEKRDFKDEVPKRRRPKPRPFNR